MTEWKIHNGDVTECLRSFPDNHFDALLSDPPAGISFMGRAWDSDKGGRDEWISWLTDVMREAYRVLKPGAFGLVWAIPRTSHWTGIAIENAGFRVRDCVYHVFGSGFPKSHSISRAIDEMNGDERPVHGTELRSNAPNGLVSIGRDSVKVERKLTSAASAASAAWEGHGTALKPGAECWWLVQKPIEGTYAENAVSYGVGGINIDGCRIGYASEADRQALSDGVDAIRERGGTMANSWKNSSDLSGANPASALGRWPVNFCMSHSASCRVVGESTTIRSILGAIDGAPVKSVGFTRGSKAQVKRGEVTEVTECADDCPVRQMNIQSGDRPGMSGGGNHKPGYEGGMFGAIDGSNVSRNDDGGASRFFATFMHDEDIADRFERFLYCAKPSSFERNFGCEHLPVKSNADMVDRDPESAGINSPRAGAGRTGGAHNDHPTIKGITLTKWLATLIQPPPRSDGPRRIVCPFAGSGGELLGAMRAGWESIDGIEREQSFCEIIDARMTRWSEVPIHLEPSEVKPPKVDDRQFSLFGKVGS